MAAGEERLFPVESRAQSHFDYYRPILICQEVLMVIQMKQTVLLLRDHRRVLPDSGGVLKWASTQRTQRVEPCF